jgi:arsenate reductase
VSDVTIWHNPRCSKSRQTLALIEERGVQPQVRKYLEDPPGEEEIRAALAALGRAPIEAMRVKEARFKELGLSGDSDSETLIRAMAENPVLIERPIVFRGSKAALGRPPEAVLDLL